jgi:hypothetical protein
VSIQDIQENPQDTSNFYLANIYQAITDPNNSSISRSPPTSPPPFSPPNSAVWANALFFLSLVISLTCALLAILLQQWARRYLSITQSRYSPHKRARIRSFFAEGVDKCLLPWTINNLPRLLDISLFLFFAGLVLFLSNVNFTIFKLVISWVGLCTAIYGCITCMPMFRHDSPYYTPLSLPAWQIVTGLQIPIFRFLRWFNSSVQSSYSNYRRFLDLEERCRRSLVWGMQKIVEEAALNAPSEMDTRTFLWTFDCSDKDDELERFFSGLPGFRSSKVVDDPLPSLPEEQKWRLYEALRGFLYRTFSTDLLSTDVKNRRAMICAKAVNPEDTPVAALIFSTILSEYQYSGPLAIGLAKILRRWENNSYVGEENILYSRSAISKIVARSQPQDNSWYILASDELGFPEPVLRDYAAHGDSLSLVILTHLVRQQFIHFRKSWPRDDFSLVLEEASTFNVLHTSPKLQHDFCALWNEIVNEALDNNGRGMAFFILLRIRNVYLALHQDTDSAPTLFSTSTNDGDDILRQPSSYPVCKVPDHHSDSTPHIHHSSASATFSRVSHDRETTTPIPSFLARSQAPIFASAHGSLTNAPPLDENTSVSDQIRTTTEPRPTSPNPITTGAPHRTIDTSPSMLHPPCTSEPTSAAPTKSNAPTSPLYATIAEPTPVAHIPPSDIEFHSSSSSHALPTPVPDNILPIGMPLPLDSAVTRTDRTTFSPESHSPMVAPAGGGLSRSWDPGSAAEEEDSANAALSREKERDVRPDSPTVTPDVLS